MLRLRLDGNEVHVSMSRSPRVPKLETTWQMSKMFCFGIFFVDFWVPKLKEKQTSWDLQSNSFKIKVLWQKCDFHLFWMLFKFKASQKAESDLISFAVWRADIFVMNGLQQSFQQLNIFSSRITSAAQMDEYFFRAHSNNPATAAFFFSNG